jgi:hypothetical protein
MRLHGQSQRYDRWYSTARWARIRNHQLLEYPLCKYCSERGIVMPAAICDHVDPHRGDVNKFWLGPFQSIAAAPGRAADVELNNDHFQKPTVLLRAGSLLAPPPFDLKAYTDHAAITG